MIFVPKNGPKLTLNAVKLVDLLFTDPYLSQLRTKRLRKQTGNEITFFHAPVGLIVFIEKNMPKGSWIDAGMFIQNVLLAAQDFGLSTCPQAALAEYLDVVREVLGLENVDIICGIAIGYGDSSHPINSYRTERESVNVFTHWY